MKRIATFTLFILAAFSVGVWSGRASVSILPTDAQMQADMEQAQRHMAEIDHQKMYLKMIAHSIDRQR